MIIFCTYVQINLIDGAHAQIDLIDGAHAIKYNIDYNSVSNNRTDSRVTTIDV